MLELAQGTYRLVWTQGLTRTRWVTLKLGLLVATALLVALALTALLTWWQTPFVQLDGALQPRVFDVEGTVPLANTVFAVALGLGWGHCSAAPFRRWPSAWSASWRSASAWKAGCVPPTCRRS